MKIDHVNAHWFGLLGRRDFSNGATLDEIWEALKQRDEFLEHALNLRNAWCEWLETPDLYPDEEMMESMSAILETAGLTLDDDDTQETT